VTFDYDGVSARETRVRIRRDLNQFTYRPTWAPTRPGAGEREGRPDDPLIDRTNKVFARLDTAFLNMAVKWANRKILYVSLSARPNHKGPHTAQYVHQTVPIIAPLTRSGQLGWFFRD